MTVISEAVSDAVLAINAEVKVLVCHDVVVYVVTLPDGGLKVLLLVSLLEPVVSMSVLACSLVVVVGGMTAPMLEAVSSPILSSLSV